MVEKGAVGIARSEEINEPDGPGYPGSDERFAVFAPFSQALGLTRIGFSHEVLAPGRRTSWPHAHSREEEFVFVIEGEPDLWVDGHLRRLAPGTGVAFPAGTGAAHTFINNTDAPVRLLVAGDHKLAGDQVWYPRHADHMGKIGARAWKDHPDRPQGPHDGVPDAARKG
jgi:uncharacterized cupin superfamily protein